MNDIGRDVLLVPYGETSSPLRILPSAAAESSKVGDPDFFAFTAEVDSQVCKDRNSFDAIPWHHFPPPGAPELFPVVTDFVPGGTVRPISTRAGPGRCNERSETHAD